MMATVTQTAAIEHGDVVKSIEHNHNNPGKVPSYTVPLPTYGDLHIGSIVCSPVNGPYSVVQLHVYEGDLWAVIVPVNNPSCAYTCRASALKVVKVVKVKQRHTKHPPSQEGGDLVCFSRRLKDENG